MYAHDIDADTRASAEINPYRCPCRGSGWIGSDYDTWHVCPYHFGGPHPESEEVESAQAWDNRTRDNARRAYAWFQDSALGTGMTYRAFRDAVFTAVPVNPTIRDYINAAESISDDARREASEARAHADGYSCALEARWAYEAAREGQDRAGMAR